MGQRLLSTIFDVHLAGYEPEKLLLKKIYWRDSKKRNTRSIETPRR